MSKQASQDELSNQMRSASVYSSNFDPSPAGSNDIYPLRDQEHGTGRNGATEPKVLQQQPRYTT